MIRPALVINGLKTSFKTDNGHTVAVDGISFNLNEREILFGTQNLRSLTEKQMRKIRGNQISMIFQEPMTSLNPLFTVRYQMMEAIRQHTPQNKLEARERAVEILRQVGLARAEELMDEYPHQLSGGMRQRDRWGGT